MIRAARMGDVDDIVRIMRSGFAEHILQATIYGTSGIADFIESHIKAPSGLSDTAYVVGELAGQVAGCIELRRLPDALFLNYIAVLPNARASGLARTLLRESILAVRAEHESRMFLDVFDDNTAAWDWYERLGFQSVSASEWWSLPLREVGHASPCTVVGYPQAEVTQERFGFSQFVVRSRMGDFTVGRIGTDWFRLTQPEAVKDLTLVSTLIRLDGRRRILGIFPQGTVGIDDVDTGVRLLSCHRMAVDLNALIERLMQSG